VSCTGPDELLDLARALPGGLTATVHGDEIDHPLAGRLLPVLVARAGRIVWNGVPTGVPVAHATQHGGPYPATTSSLHTSVGTSAVRRFLRPVAWQEVPDHLLPEPLRDVNPGALVRLVDGRLSRNSISLSDGGAK
jgi:NADP-dependent aldehyde dehydrogenase